MVGERGRSAHYRVATNGSKRIWPLVVCLLYKSRTPIQYCLFVLKCTSRLHTIRLFEDIDNNRVHYGMERLVLGVV